MIIRSEEENIIISDLSPGTWYTVQLTAHNGAGSRVVTAQVATLDTSGQALPPRHRPGHHGDTGHQGGSHPGAGAVDGSVAVPIIFSILLTTTVMLIAVYIYRKRR